MFDSDAALCKLFGINEDALIIYRLVAANPDCIKALVFQTCGNSPITRKHFRNLLRIGLIYKSGIESRGHGEVRYLYAAITDPQAIAIIGLEASYSNLKAFVSESKYNKSLEPIAEKIEAFLASNEAAISRLAES